MTSGSISRARLTVGCGPLALPLAGRLVMSIGAETELAVDRVQEAALIAETIAGLCSAGARDSSIELTVRAHRHLLELRAGPLGAGGAQRLLAADAQAPGGGIMRSLASRTAVRQSRDGGETLVLSVTPHPVS